METHRSSRLPDRRRNPRGRHQVDDGRRADLRVDRRYGRCGVEHGGVGLAEAVTRRAVDGSFTRAVRAGWLASFWAGQMVSGRAIATLGADLLLAQGRRSAVAR